ncbi:MAG: hypothetical protein LBV62_00200 [Rickettsiales bacterium]|nr:hypothetical protein [Rickettsiales bacterium]
MDGALEIGEGNVIRIQNGQYHDMKGKVKMTFKVGDDKKIEVILSSENASSFGKIMVYMDEENCKIFSECCKELEEEPRISKVVEAAKSFVQMKNSEVSPPLFALESVQHSQSSGQGLPAH